VNPFRRLFRPRRTVWSVAREILDGLRDGSVTLDGTGPGDRPKLGRVTPSPSPRESDRQSAPRPPGWRLPPTDG
jgi:hypothetical protein